MTNTRIDASASSAASITEKGGLIMIVLDCNAAIAITNKTPEGLAILELIHDDEEVIAPDLFKYETANVIRKYVASGRFEAEDASTVLKSTLALVDEFYSVNNLVFESLRESIALQHHTSDIVYMVLARRTAATMFTLDKRLQQLCIDNGLSCISLEDI